MREVQDSHSPLVCEMTLEPVEVASVVLLVSGWRQEEYLQRSGKNNSIRGFGIACEQTLCLGKG